MVDPISRRQAITYGLGAVAAGALAGGGRTLNAAGLSRRSGHMLGVGRPPWLPQPRVLSSADGELSVRLVGVPGVVDMNAPKMVRTYTLGGHVPGYTWELRAGDTLKVLLQNRLPKLPRMPVHMDRPHQWTNMNLHTHGLHVSPSGNADNVFLDIPPGCDHRLEIPLPPDHPAGLFWYHPHRHGGVTQQLRAGMAGMLIVRGDIDQVEEVCAAQEKVMVLQGIELGDDFQLLDPIPEPKPDQDFFPATQVLYTVNGVLTPRLHMYPGQVQRWRLVNAAADNFMSLALKNHDFHVLAWDGLTLPAPDTTDVVMLSPGNRVDLLVKAGRPGVYDLVLTPGSSGMPNIPGMPTSGLPGPASGGMPMPGLTPLPDELVPRAILTVEVSGRGPAMGLPTALPAWDPPILPISRYRNFSFSVQRTPANEFLNFGIDGKPYDMSAPPYQVPVGTAEEWTLTNAFDPKLMEHAHVFHIHTNPFKITKRNGKVLSPPLWRDTYVLTKSAGDTMTFESNFVDYTGKFVEHCHLVPHEDLGMMSAIEVVPSNTPAPSPMPPLPWPPPERQATGSE
jgi:FtsP/CotA-like multicopper oxidase with cupredoxin domain